MATNATSQLGRCPLEPKPIGQPLVVDNSKGEKLLIAAAKTGRKEGLEFGGLDLCKYAITLALGIPVISALICGKAELADNRRVVGVLSA